MSDAALAKLEQRVVTLAKQFGVVNCEIISRTPDFDAASILLQEPSGDFTILTCDDIGLPLRLFSQLHEIGHIALGYVHDAPQQAHETAIETEINLWALDQIRSLISPELSFALRAAMRVDEDAAYRIMEDQLLTDMDQISQIKIGINPKFVHRKNDRSLFDFESFKLFRFNQTAHRLLEFLIEAIPFGDYFARAEEIGVSADDADEFLQKCIDASLVLVCQGHSSD